MKCNRWVWENPKFPNFVYDKSTLFEVAGEINRLLGKLEEVNKMLASEEIVQTVTDILTDEALSTSEIEGNLLKRESVRASISKRLSVEHVTGSETVETDALVAMIFDARQNHEPITHERLYGWQASLFPTGYSGIHKVEVGRYRTEENEIVSGPHGKRKVHYECIPVGRVEAEMDSFIKWLNEDKSNALIKAAAAHLRFIEIHPFEDGNGRVARALSDYVLSKKNAVFMDMVSLSTQIIREKKAYYALLERMGRYTGELDISEWVEWFLRQILNALEYSYDIVKVVMKKAQFWRRHASTILNARQLKAVNRLFESLPDGFEGGMDTKKYMSLTTAGTRMTATRDLRDLEEKGVLKQVGTGKRLRYELNL
jgi:Fic family protein